MIIFKLLLSSPGAEARLLLMLTLKAWFSSLKKQQGQLKGQYYTGWQSIPGELIRLPVFLFPEDSGHVRLEPTKDSGGLSPVIVSVSVFLFQTIPILKANLHQSYSSKCISVGTLMFLEKKLTVSVHLFFSSKNNSLFSLVQAGPKSLILHTFPLSDFIHPPGFIFSSRLGYI